MRRVGRVRGRRSNNNSRVTGRRKRRDRWKQFAAGEHINMNPACAEFYLQTSLKMSLNRGLGSPALDEQWSAGVDRADEDVVQVKKETVNNMIEKAMARVDAACADEEGAEGETTAAAAMACPEFELTSGAILAGDMIPAIEEAFHREFGIYENAVEGSNFSETHFARRWGSVLSQESWSDVEFLESELESFEDDDWCMVVDGEDAHV